MMDWEAKALELFPADDAFQTIQRRAFLVGVGFGIERAAQRAETFVLEGDVAKSVASWVAKYIREEAPK